MALAEFSVPSVSSQTQRKAIMTSTVIYGVKSNNVNNLVDKNTTAKESNSQNSKYCTYLTIYSGNKLPPFYIGSTSVGRIKSGYRGSVSSKKYKSTWLSEIKENPELFRTKIISYHETREEAISKEEYFQKNLKVIKSEMYINMCYARRGFDSTLPEIKKAISEGNTGKKRTPEQIAEMKRSRVGMNKGIPKSEDHRKKISNSRKESELCRIRSIENLPEPQIGELNGMHKSNRDYNSDREKLRSKRISESKLTRTKDQNLTAYSRVKSPEEIEKIKESARNRHVVYVSRLSDRKVLDYRNFCKYLKRNPI